MYKKNDVDIFPWLCYAILGSLVWSKCFRNGIGLSLSNVDRLVSGQI